jgi:hypothetical protein
VVSALCTTAFYFIGHTSSALPELLAPSLDSAWARRLVLALYHVLPDLNLLSINNLVVHNIPEVPGFTIRALAYTVLTVCILLVASAMCFKRRDLV